MFDIGFFELVLVGIIALLVLGPERLPHAARMTGAFLGRMTRMVQSVRDEVEREINVYEMQQRIKRQVEDGMIGDLRKELTEAQKAIQEGFTATTQTSSEPASLPEAVSEMASSPDPGEALPSAAPLSSPVKATTPSAPAAATPAPVPTAASAPSDAAATTTVSRKEPS